MSGTQMATLGVMNMSVRNGGSIAENTTGGMNIQSDGSVTPTGAGALVTNWFNPTGVGVGNTFWVRVTRTGGSGSTTILGAGTWQQLNVVRAFSAGGGAGTSTGIVEIATDSLGANIVGSYPISLNNTI